MERLLARVDKTAGCWLWTGAVKGNGYGVIGVSIPRRDNAYVHRVMYEHSYGPIPPGMEVCHHCDVRNCVRPEHLFLGTHQENVADCIAKERHKRGEMEPRAKLTEAHVRVIRDRVAAGERRKDLAVEYGVCTQNVDMIVTRKRWAHVD